MLISPEDGRSTCKFCRIVRHPAFLHGIRLRNAKSGARRRFRSPRRARFPVRHSVAAMSVQVAGNGSEARVEQREEAAAEPAARPQNTYRALDEPLAASAEPGFQGARQPSRRVGARSADSTGRERPATELDDSASMLNVPSHS